MDKKTEQAGSDYDDFHRPSRGTRGVMESQPARTPVFVPKPEKPEAKKGCLFGLALALLGVR